MMIELTLRFPTWTVYIIIGCLLLNAVVDVLRLYQWWLERELRKLRSKP
jgi:hypothetical protein